MARGAGRDIKVARGGSKARKSSSPSPWRLQHVSQEPIRFEFRRERCPAFQILVPHSLVPLSGKTLKVVRRTVLMVSSPHGSSCTGLVQC